MSYNSKYTGSGVDNVLDKVIPAIAPTQTADGKEGLVPAAPKDSYLGNKVLHSDMTWKEAVTKEYVDNAVNSASWKKIIVDTLPDESAADSNTIYLVRDALASSESGNVYNEYILVTPEEGDPYFETLGSVSTKVDVKYIELDLFNADSGTLTEDQYQHIADCYADKVVLSVQGTEIKASNLSYENEVYSIRLFFLNKQNEDTRLGIELTDIDIAADHTFTVTRSSYFVDNAGMAYSAYMASNPAVVNTLVDLPIDGYNVIANIDTASTLSVSSGMVDGRELQIRVNNTASTELKLTLPTQDPYVNLSAESVTIAPGGFIEINIWYVGGQYLLRVGVSEADEEDIKPVNADWEATSGLAQILNRPNLHSVAESGNYNELENKPDIPDVSGFVESAGAASSDADGLTFNLQKKNGTVAPVKIPLATETANGIMSSADKVKLGGLSNYNDTEIRGLITELKTAFDAMMSGDTTNAIKTFNEVIAFLDSIKDTESLSGIISGISTDIENVRADIPTNNNELENGAGYITANDIPEQVQADWNATSGVSYIQNKPELKPVAISGSYNDLADTPTSLPANGGNADTVNGFTVGTNVPADAKFTDTVYNDSAIRSEIAKAIKPTLITQVSTLTSMPINNYSIKATVNANTAISFAQTPEEGMEYMIDILSTAAFTQALPNSGGWQSNEGSLNVEAGKVASISIRYIHGIYVVRV